MILQVHVGEVERHQFTAWQSDDINALPIVSIVIRPVGRDDDAFCVCKDTSTAWVS